MLILKNRGGVEDTRLEVKAKDTKKFEAKAKDTKKKTRPRLRTALPRTDPLEAKDRNVRGQGHLSRNFLGAPQNFNSSKNSDVLGPRSGQLSRT